MHLNSHNAQHDLFEYLGLSVNSVGFILFMFFCCEKMSILHFDIYCRMSMVFTDIFYSVTADLILQRLALTNTVFLLTKKR